MGTRWYMMREVMCGGQEMVVSIFVYHILTGISIASTICIRIYIYILATQHVLPIELTSFTITNYM
jgi:hypothetical protein